MIKQHNESAVNFALAGIMSFIIAMILLFFLWQNITTEKQITELQATGQHLAKIVASQAFAEGDAKTFSEFAQLVKSFNQQWDDLKQLENNLPVEKIKEIDAIKKELNINVPKWLALQKDIFAQTLAQKAVYSNIQKMRQMNDKVINILLHADADKQQILLIQRVSHNLPPIEFKKYNELDYFSFMEIWGDSFFRNGYLLAEFLQIDNNKKITTIGDLEAEKIIANELLFYNESEALAVFINKNFYDIRLEINNLSILVHKISEALFLLNKNSIHNFFVYFVFSVLFAIIYLLIFLNRKKYDIVFVVYFLLTFTITIVIVCEISKKHEFFIKTNNIKTSNDYINEVNYLIEIKNFNSIVQFKLANDIYKKINYWIK